MFSSKITTDLIMTFEATFFVLSFLCTKYCILFLSVKNWGEVVRLTWVISTTQKWVSSTARKSRERETEREWERERVRVRVNSFFEHNQGKCEFWDLSRFLQICSKTLKKIEPSPTLKFTLTLPSPQDSLLGSRLNQGDYVLKMLFSTLCCKTNNLFLHCQTKSN